MAAEISAPDLRAELTDGAELALVDVREEGAFSREHLFLAACIPVSHLELRIDRLVPRKDVRMVLTDGGPSDFGLADRAAEKLAELGYDNVRILTGGTAGWKAEGFEVFSGVNVPSKAFGEYVEHWYDTPRLPAEELHSRVEAGEDIVILDSRPMTEFNRMSIPGGVDCPGAELVYRVAEMAPDPNTTIVVNCAGRTRSIIGCQSLVNAGLPNKIYALKDGTMGWNLAGYEVARGETTHAPAPSGETLDTAKQRAADVAARFGVTRTNAAELGQWQGEAETTTYLLDVRTEDEYLAGHWPGAHHAAGGQLVQATDEYVATRNARIVLADSADGVRATMTAHWLIQLGWPSVHVLTDSAPAPETGPAPAPLSSMVLAETLTTDELSAVLDSGQPVALVDLSESLVYRKGHVPGAKWSIRARLGDSLAMHNVGMVILMASDARLAHLAALDLKIARPELIIRVYAEGLAGWQKSGRPVAEGLTDAMTAVDDVWWKPYDHQGGVQKAMQDYLTWEVGLVEQVERDGLIRFLKFE